MCRTSYKRYRNCECVYVEENPTCCPNFTSDHPESYYNGPFKPKLLTWTHEGLDLDLDGMDLMSADVNDERAPKGLTCPTITAIPKDEPTVESCPLCDSPRALGILQEKRAEGRGVSVNSVGKSAGKLADNSVDEVADPTYGTARRRKDDLEHNQARRRAKRPITTQIEESSSRFAAKSMDRPIQIQSQTPATRSTDRQNGLAEIPGHKQADSISCTNTAEFSSSALRSYYPHYMDP